jgi:hypothetical protein
MIYGKTHTRTGVELDRDVYAEQFADPGDIITNYKVSLSGDVILESEDRLELARDLVAIAKRFEMIAKFLRRKRYR